MSRAERSLSAVIAPGDRDEEIVAAPAVGRFSPMVADGAVVEPSMQIGTLHVLRRIHRVILPPTARGRIRWRDRSPGRGVGYGDALAVLEPVDLAGAEEGGGSDLAEHEEVFPAPTDGQFYRRPSPDEPYYVEPGDVIEPGETIGLVEVMKFFYPIELDAPEPRRLVRFVAEDATPVSAGDPLAVMSRHLDPESD